MSSAVKNEKPKKPIWKRWWVIALAAVVVIGIFSSLSGGGKNAAAPADGGAATAVAAETPAAAAPAVEASASNAPVVKKTAKPASVPMEYRTALIKAEEYDSLMHMSKKGLLRQLTSSYGEKFSKKAATYAVDHVDADWKANALSKAKDYQEQQAMSPERIRTQLTSSYGEQFTAKQAAYAIKHLND